MSQIPIIIQESEAENEYSNTPTSDNAKSSFSVRYSPSTSLSAHSSSHGMIKSKSNAHLHGSSIFSSPRRHNEASNQDISHTEQSWSELKLRVMPLFNGEGLKGAIEELNEMVNSINSLVEKVQELVKSGILIFSNKLNVSEKLVARMVENWSFFYGTVLPYFQGCFLPLEQELRLQHMADSLSIRKMLLAGYRDHFIFPILDKIVEATNKALNDPESAKTPDTIGRIFQMLTVLLEIKDEHQTKLIGALNALNTEK